MKIAEGLAHFAAGEGMKSFRELVGIGRKQ
jgi:hypothetical protein